MAIRHFLALDIPETACATIIKINDSSVYGTGMVIDCPRLQITLPGTNQPIELVPPPTTGFVLNLSGITLGMQSMSTSTLMELPDGLYTITYSVSPNNLVYVTHYHLRTTKAKRRYFEELCKLQLQTCEPTNEYLQKLNELRYIFMLIDAAKAKAEYCHATGPAVDMLSYAIKLLDSFDSSCCVTCNN